MLTVFLFSVNLKVCSSEDEVILVGKFSSSGNETNRGKIFPMCFAGCRLIGIFNP